MMKTQKSRSHVHSNNTKQNGELVDWKKLVDRICSKVLLDKLNFLSVNQLKLMLKLKLNAQAKLCEIWKAINIAGNPTKSP